MDIVQLQNFPAIAEFEHLTKAASHLHISQPALSASLSRLENELGLELFDRVGRRLHLNENGRILLNYANNILQNVADARAELAAYSASKNPTLSFFLTSKHGLDEYYIAYSKEHPEVTMRHIEIHLHDIPRVLMDKDCDFIVTTCTNPEEFGCSYEVANEAPLQLAVQKNHPLAQRKSIRLEELKDEDFICMPARNSFQATVTRLCNEAGFAQKQVAECYFCNLFAYLLNGVGIALVTDNLFRNFNQMDFFRKELTLIPIENENALIKNVLLWRTDRKMTGAAKEFLQTVRENSVLRNR